MSAETNAAVQQPEHEKPVNEPEIPTEQAVIEPETPPEPAEAAVPTEEPPADEAAASEPTAEKADASAAEIAELKGKVHALTAGANPDSLGDLLTLAAANVSESKTLEQAIDETLEKYPVFKNSAPPSITTSVDTKNDSPTEQTDAIINKIMGIR